MDATDSTSPVARVLDRVYNNSRINSRFFCIPDLLAVAAGGREGGSGPGLESTTGIEEREEGDAAAAAEEMVADSTGTGRGAEERRGTGRGEGLQLFYPADGR